jgi:hypothetical protein
MPVTLSTNADSKLLIIQWADWRGQRRTDRILLKGTVANEDVVEIVDRLDQLSNARMLDVSLVVSFAVTGYKAAAASNVPNENIQEFMALNFSGVNPINSRKRVFKTVSIPAPLKAIEDASGNGRAVGNNTTLNALVADLATNLAYVAPNGTTYAGFFQYTGGQRLSGAEIVDNV